MRSVGRSPVSHLRRILLGVLACAALAAVVVPGVLRPSPARAQDPGYAVTVTPTADLTDGKQMTINVKAFEGTVIYHAFARVCRAGVQYQPGTDSVPNEDFRDNGPN